MTMFLITKRNKKTQQDLKKQKKKFNYNNFIKEYYIDNNGEAYISTKVTSINDIISAHSINNYEWINPNFSNYIENMAKYIPLGEQITIEICGMNFTKAEQDLITKVIHQYFGLKLGDAIIDVNINRRKSILLLLFSLITLVVLFFLNKLNVIDALNELIIFSLSYLMWTFYDFIIIDGSELKIKKKEAMQLADVNIIFNEK